MNKFIFAILLLVLTPKVFANETPWVHHLDMAESRIIAAKNTSEADGTAWFAWELRLKPDWKVYWRSPGEAGLPPVLSLKDNNKEINLSPRFPLPERFELFGLQTFGYGTQFVLPFKLEGVTANAPLTLGLAVDFMICKDICIPFTSEYMLKQTGDNTSDAEPHSATISMWLDRVPDVNGEAVAGLRIINTEVKGAVGHQNIIFEVEADQTLSRADILIESDEYFRFGKPKIDLIGRGNKAKLIVSVDGGKKKYNVIGRLATLTFTDGRGNAIERKVKF